MIINIHHDIKATTNKKFEELLLEAKDIDLEEGNNQYISYILYNKFSL